MLPRRSASLSTGVLLAGLLCAGAGWAADSATVTVTANVTGVCMFNASTATIALGALDPANGTDVSVNSVPVTFWCTNGTSYSLSKGNGNNFAGGTMNLAGTDTANLGALLPYSMTLNTATSGTGSGKTSPIDLDVTVQVLKTNYQNATVGNYSDAVVFSITP